MVAHKPDGYPSLSPYFVVEDAEASLSFIERMFGGERLRIVRNQDGRIRHGEIRMGDAVLMLADGTGEWPARPAMLHLYVEDADACYARALELGATAIQAPEQKDDADRREGFAAPGGIDWWVATQIDAA